MAEAKPAVSRDYLPTLAIHVVWHPRFERGAAYGRALFKHLFEDPDDLGSHGLRIPVFHWRSSGEPHADVPPPQDLPLGTSAVPVLVPLIDDWFGAGLGWDRFLQRTRVALPKNNHLLPVQLSETLPREVGGLQAVQLHQRPHRLRVPELLSEVTYRLWELLGADESTELGRVNAEKVPVFLSHSIDDGKHIAEQVSEFLSRRGPVGAFFAPRDVPRGAEWRTVLRDHAGHSLLLAIRTDCYASREWCQIEVLEAKRHGMPVVVLDALARREARGFPYLGNAPVLRWRSRDREVQLEELLGVMLREALRSRHFHRRVDTLRSLCKVEVPVDVQPAPPELLTLLERLPATDRARLLIYPDPPLGADELAVIRSLDGELEPITPLMLLAT